jgi:hypothetical protein
MSSLSYWLPKTVIKESQIHGRGRFAGEPLAKGEIVAITEDHLALCALANMGKHGGFSRLMWLSCRRRVVTCTTRGAIMCLQPSTERRLSLRLASPAAVEMAGNPYKEVHNHG